MARPRGTPQSEEWKLAQSRRIKQKWDSGLFIRKSHHDTDEQKMMKSEKHKLWLSVNGHPCKGKNCSEQSNILRSVSLIGRRWSESRRKAHRLKFEVNKRRWLNYGSNSYHPDWPIIRSQIYERDNRTCQECQIICSGRGKSKIQCHHIDFDRSNNSMDNLITLCGSCHGKTTQKPEEWIQYYQDKMMMKTKEVKTPTGAESM